MRNELQPVTNKDKELMEVVRNLTLCTESEANKYIYVLFFFFILQGIERTSNLFAPIMLLEGHMGEVFSCEFHPDGEILLSAGFDRNVCKSRGPYRFKLGLLRIYI